MVDENSNAMTAEPSVEVRVSRSFSASPERVFDAWLDPAMIGRWMFGSALRDEEIVRIALDARVGGAFSFVVRCELTLTHEMQPQWADFADRVEAGWTTMLKALAAALG